MSSEKRKQAQKERYVRQLIWRLSKGELALRKVGVGTERFGKVGKDEKSISQSILDYVIIKVKSKRLIALADVVSTTYDYQGSKFFPVALWKVEVIKVNANVLPSALIYTLEKEKAHYLKDRIWWYIGRDVKGETVLNMPTSHWGTTILQDVVKSAPNAWTGGLEKLITNLLEL